MTLVFHPPGAGGMRSGLVGLSRVLGQRLSLRRGNRFPLRRGRGGAGGREDTLHSILREKCQQCGMDKGLKSHMTR